MTGRSAVIGGSSRGIGRAIARTFLEEGCRTMITGRDAKSLEESRFALAAEFGEARVRAFSGDLRTERGVQDCRQTFTEAWGVPDHVVANVGSGSGAMGAVSELDVWKASFETNFWPAVLIVQAFLPDMTARKSGSAVVVGSIAGVESIRAPMPYSASKAALASWVKNVAREVGTAGVRINLVSPGNVLVDGGTWERKSAEDPDGVRRYLASEVPLGRLAAPPEIASVVAFLCSDRASFITGAQLVADGGQTRSL